MGCESGDPLRVSRDMWDDGKVNPYPSFPFLLFFFPFFSIAIKKNILIRMTYECVIDTEIIKLNKMIGIKCFLFVITENVGVYLY